ncbi:MAG: murein biosynthesis integral membrane protein MurJ [Jatrophihabitans sp.]
MTGPDQHPWIFPSTDWSEPAIYRGATPAQTQVAEPAAPSSDDLELGTPGHLARNSAEVWGATTYSGPRRHRPAAHVAPVAIPDAPSTPDAATPATDAAGPLVTDQPSPDAPAPLDTPAPAATTTGASVGGRADRSLLSSSRTMAIASLASRITGFLRSVALAAALGVTTSRVADAYNIANALPNMVYELLLGGVLSSVIIPLVVHAQEHDPDKGTAYTQRLLSVAVASLGAATLVAVFAAPLLAWAYGGNHDQRELTSIFATLLLPEIFFYGLGAMFTAILNTRGVYGAPAWAPVLNNLVTIATIGVFALVPGPKELTTTTITTTQILVLGIGTTLGIALQAVFLVPFLRRIGFRWRWRWHAAQHDTGRMAEVRQLAGWVLGYVAISQVGLYIVTRVANNYQGGPTTFAYADLLFQVPYGILGVSLLTVLMPRMSRSAARGDTAGVVADLSLGARLSAVGLLPVTAGLIVLGPSLTTVLFFYGRTDLSDARHIGIVLAMGSFGLLPFALVMLQMRVFYATRDARSPTMINVFMIITKVVIVLIASQVLDGRHVIESLSVATSTSYLVGAIVGHRMLTGRFGFLGFTEVARTVARVAGAAAAGAVVAYVIVLASQHAIGTGRGGALPAVLGGSLIGGAVYVFAARALKVTELQEIVGSLRR